MRDHLVRIGALGQIGRFQVAEPVRLDRGTRVICRTVRGLEFGSVLNALHGTAAELPRTGTILRRATAEDHLLWARVERNRQAAFLECDQLLTTHLNNRPHASGVALMDVELLFDGKSIFFYFLGEMPAELTKEIEELTTDLAEAYEAKIQLRRFAEAMTIGCGPDCGTGESCGDSGGCGSCSIASACSSVNANATARD